MSEWPDNDGDALFTKPPKKGKIIRGKLELMPPEFEIPDSGGGSHRVKVQT